MLKKYELKLQAEVSQSFHSKLAAQSLDINTEEKSTHLFSVMADLESEFDVGLIVGASGSGKSTLASSVYGGFKTFLDKSSAVIDQFPQDWSYEMRAAALTGMGLTSVPCWIKPAGVLSNGQQARADAALALAAATNGVTVIDEWTSVVDRTVAKAMSNCVQKFARKNKKKVVLISCHYDVIEWLDPDWIIDCNSQRFIDRRSLHPDERKRKEQLVFDIREVPRSSWNYLSKYHYLSKDLPRGKCFFYGLFHNNDQIGFMCFANYMPIRQGQLPIYHSNRTVIHPDFAGLGLGHKFNNATCKIFKQRFRGEVDIRSAFSAIPLYIARKRDIKNWKLIKIDRRIGKQPEAGAKMGRKTGFRKDIKIFSFQYIGE